MMHTSSPGTPRLRLVGRVIAIGIVGVLAIGCARSDAVGPSAAGAVTSSARTSQGQGPQPCAPDDKLIGRIAVSTADVPGTWWWMTRERFDALGVTDYKAALEGFYGRSFATLDDAIQYLIDGVASYDANANGYVCAYDERGTRAHLGINSLYLFGISDDKHYGA